MAEGGSDTKGGRSHPGRRGSVVGKAHAHEFFSLEAVDFGQLKEEVTQARLLFSTGLALAPDERCVLGRGPGLGEPHRGGPPDHGGHPTRAAAQV